MPPIEPLGPSEPEPPAEPFGNPMEASSPPQVWLPPHVLFTREFAEEQGVPGWVADLEGFAEVDAEAYRRFELELADTLEAARRDDGELAALDPWTAKSAGAREFARVELPKILDRLREYRRQVYGVIVDGRPMLYVSFLPGADWDEFGDGFADWRERTIAVSDGGFWFWAVLYDPATGDYTGLDLHGYA
ncbi:MAG: hypothetical protein ACYTF3_04425 [Planctomycetota bacterium]